MSKDEHVDLYYFQYKMNEALADQYEEDRDEFLNAAAEYEKLCWPNSDG